MSYHYLTQLLRVAALAGLLLAGWPGWAQQGPAFEWAVTCGVSAGQATTYTLPYSLTVDAQGNSYVTGYFSGAVTIGSTALTSVGFNDVFVAKLDPQGNYLWVSTAGGASGENGRCVAVDNAGGVYVGGDFDSYSLTFGGGSTILYNSSAKTEAFVAKLDAATGQWRWAHRAGGTGPDAITALAVTTQGEVSVAGEFASATADFGSIVLAGTPRNSSSFRQDVFVAKLSSGGQWLWAVRGGGGSYGGKTTANLVTDAAGFLYLAGAITGGVSLNNTMPSYTASFGSTTLTGSYTGNNVDYSQDSYVAKLDAAGNWLWAVQGNTAGTNLAAIKDLATDRQGHLYVGGQYASTQARFGSTVLPNQGAQIPDNSGVPYPPAYYRTNAFVAQLDAATGTWNWAVRTGGQNDALVECLVADSQGRVYVTGSFPDGVAPLSTSYSTVAQLDGATGNWRWSGTGVYFKLTTDSFNRLYMASYFVAASATYGPFTLTSPVASSYTGVVSRLGAGVLATRAGAGSGAGLQVWPNPTTNRQAQVSGAGPGAAVQVFDVLGRLVCRATMPTTGPLTLALSAYLPAGVYVVRSGRLAQQLVLE